MQYKLIVMVATKTATLNLRIDPMLKEMLRTAAVREHRSIANMIELLIRDHCLAEGIPIPEQREMFEVADDA
ncbi:hypothetical protein OAV86_03050 [Pseudomonadales bacterium]|nr:hypothetical protein [Pseudomonadales bacterium]